MSGLPPDPTGLGAVLGDPEVRRMVGDLVARKLKADLDALRGGAALLGRVRVNPDGVPAGPREGVVRDLVRLQLEYYGALIDMTAEFHERTRALLEGDPPPASPGGAREPDPEMRLSGPPGGTARAAFRVENTTTAPMSVELVASRLRHEGTGEEATPAVVFDPPRAELTPGQEAQIGVMLPVAKDMAPGAVYRGTIKAAGIDSVRIAVRLEVEAPPPGPARKRAAAKTAAAKTAAAQTAAAGKPAARKAAARKRTTARKATT
ncbi:MAG TPA: hypothetical protein VFG74_10395 [Miltoncostaeaceae bacterium]|jgi:ribonuclease E|nr:hypothetical protein [Miltoncostaeaceae bacterium]